VVALDGLRFENPKQFLDNWMNITTEIGERYRDGLAGWFFDDGCVYYPAEPGLPPPDRIGESGKSGARLVCYKPPLGAASTTDSKIICAVRDMAF